MTPSVRSFVCFVAALVAPAAVFAQTPSPAPPAWTGSIGAGLALTSGNSDTSNLNVAFKAEHDPKTNTVFKTEGLYLRGSNKGERTADNATLRAKVERRFSDRAYAFVQAQYLRDSFKAIDYFIAPALGVGYKVVDSDRAKLSTDVALGPSWEKNPGLDARAKLALSFGEKASYMLSKTATITQGFSSTLVADEWGDGLYTFSVGLAASVTGRTQLKVEVIDVYKNRPPTAAIKKNDVSTLVSVLFQF